MKTGKIWGSSCAVNEDGLLEFDALSTGKYRVIKKSLCTWWLQHTSFLPHYVAQSECLPADCQSQGDTRLALTPSVLPNSNYVIMVRDWNCLKYFCVFLYCNQVHRDFFIPLYLPTFRARVTSLLGLFIPEDEGIAVLRNIGNYSLVDMTSHSRSLER
jgi:hypothetical protein